MCVSCLLYSYPNMPCERLNTHTICVLVCILFVAVALLCHSRTGCALQISAVMWLTSPLGETVQRAQTVHFILSDCTAEDIQKTPSIRHEAKMAMLNRFAFLVLLTERNGQAVQSFGVYSLKKMEGFILFF